MTQEAILTQDGSLTVKRIDCQKFQLDRIAELNEILDLMNVVQPHIKRSLDLLRWQYFESPAGPGQIYLIEEQGKIATIVCAAATKIQTENQVLSARILQDGMTHPDYRRRGLFHKLAQHCFDDLAENSHVSYGFPNLFSQGLLLKAGWKRLCSVPARSKNLAGWKRSKDEIEMDEVTTPLDSTVSTIWMEAGRMEAGCSAAVFRDAAYLNWRYGKTDQVYHRFLIEKNKGLVILKEFNNGVETVVHICELFVRASERALVGSVLQFCQQFAIECGAQLITAWLPPQHAYATAFEEEGFGLVDTDRNVIVAVPSTEQEVILDRGWYFSQGDSDVY
jgi:hypothetical protein